MNDAAHAWIYAMGVVTGILLSLGGVAFIAHLVRALIVEAKLVIEEMRRVVVQARAISAHVAEHYVPLSKKVDQIEREVNDIRNMLRDGRLGGG